MECSERKPCLWYMRGELADKARTPLCDMMGKVCWLWGQRFFLSFCFKISYNIECFYPLYIKGTKNGNLFLKYSHFSNLQNLNICILLIIFLFSSWGLLYSQAMYLVIYENYFFFPFKLLYSNMNACTFLLIFFISKLLLRLLGISYILICLLFLQTYLSVASIEVISTR